MLGTWSELNSCEILLHTFTRELPLTPWSVVSGLADIYVDVKRQGDFGTGRGLQLFSTLSPSQNT